MPAFDPAAMANMRAHLSDPHHNSVIVKHGEEACVDYRGLYYLSRGQCCAKNPMKQDAALHNPFGFMSLYWKGKDGKKQWGVKCIGE